MATSSSNPLASGVSAELYRALIGPRSQDYYLRQFTRFDEAGKTGPSWHWMAYWNTLNWLVYRRMWGWALAYAAAVLGTVLLIFGAGKLVFDYGDITAVLLLLGLLAIAFVVPAVYANAWFYTNSNEKISAALRKADNAREACQMLARQSGSDQRVMVLALVNAAVLGLAFLLYNWMDAAERQDPLAAVGETQSSGNVQSGRIQDLSQPTPPLVAAPAATPANTPISTPVNTPVSAALSSNVGAEMTTTANLPTSAPPVLLSPAPLIVTSPAAPPVAAAEPTAAKPAQVAQAAAPAAPTAPDPGARVRAAAAEPPPAAKPPPPAKPPTRSRYPLQYVWVLQVGAFEQEANAQQVVEQVQSLGLEAGAAPYRTPEGPVLMRVRLGPYETRREANLVALRLKTLNLPVLVLRQRP